MNVLRVSLAIGLAGMCSQLAMANCKAPATGYEIIDLGQAIEGQTEARATSIDARGRIIIAAINENVSLTPIDVMRQTNGKMKRIKLTDDGAERQTRRLLDNRNRLVDYRKSEAGYIPVEIQTLVDRRGGEIAVSEYCKAPEERWQMRDFQISRSGLEAAGVFEDGAAIALARCRVDDSAEILFETEEDISLYGINDDGVLAGLIEDAGTATFWRWDTDGLSKSTAAGQYMEITLVGLDEQGHVFADTLGQITSSSLRYSPDETISPVEVLPGQGWDVFWQKPGPCGEVFGLASYTNFASFAELPEAEQARLRDDFDAFWAYAGEREDALFVWSPQLDGRFLNSLVDGLKDWNNLEILDINNKGQAVGSAANEDGEIRPLLLSPIRN